VVKLHSGALPERCSDPGRDRQRFQPSAFAGSAKVLCIVDNYFNDEFFRDPYPVRIDRVRHHSEGLNMHRTAAILVLFVSVAHAATSFDLATDFSFRDNPSKVWQYGYSVTNSLDPAEFRLDKYADASGPVGFWHPSISSGPGPGWYPYVAYNTTKRSQMGSSNGWCVRPGEVAMEASNTGQYSLIRFVAPSAGTYKITARFEGVHFGLSSTDVHVLHNGASLFEADIAGYGGDPAFHAVQGASPTASYSGKARLMANDTVTFAVGYGKNKTNFGDTTGLVVHIELLAGGDP
jgi:hypothetical protein